MWEWNHQDVHAAVSEELLLQICLLLLETPDVRVETSISLEYANAEAFRRSENTIRETLLKQAMEKNEFPDPRLPELLVGYLDHLHNKRGQRMMLEKHGFTRSDDMTRTNLACSRILHLYFSYTTRKDVYLEKKAAAEKLFSREPLEKNENSFELDQNKWVIVLVSTVSCLY